MSRGWRRWSSIPNSAHESSSRLLRSIESRVASSCAAKCGRTTRLASRPTPPCRRRHGRIGGLFFFQGNLVASLKRSGRSRPLACRTLTCNKPETEAIFLTCSLPTSSCAEQCAAERLLVVGACSNEWRGRLCAPTVSTVRTDASKLTSLVPLSRRAAFAESKAELAACKALARLDRRLQHAQRLGRERASPHASARLDRRRNPSCPAVSFNWPAPQGVAAAPGAGARLPEDVLDLGPDPRPGAAPRHRAAGGPPPWEAAMPSEGKEDLPRAACDLKSSC